MEGWIDQDERSAVTAEYHWSKNNDCLIRSFNVQVGDQTDMLGIQFIGWAPSTKQIRSWEFDYDGGFEQGTSRKKGNSWSNPTMADGWIE